MAVRAEAAWAQVCFAAAALDGGRPDAARQAASAKVVAIEAGRVNAAGNIQIHGGMGFTEEHDAHLYVRRAHVYEVAGGGRRRHLAALVDRSSPPKHINGDNTKPIC
jgi:alkylation response protein AidB-like acyl-CoA dehydrogenase